MHINEQYQYIIDYLSIKKKNLKNTFESWIKHYNFVYKEFSPTDLHAKYQSLNKLILIFLNYLLIVYLIFNI